MNKFILKSIGSDILKGNKEIIKEYDFMTGEELLFVLPNYSVLKETRKELLSSLGAINNSMLNTFDDLAGRFSKEKLYLEKAQVMLLVKKIINENPGIFEGTRLNENNHQDISSFILDLKGQGIGPDLLIGQDEFWELKILGQVYELYEKRLEEKEIDDVMGQYLNASKNIRKRKLKGNLYINGFIEFRPFELGLIQAFVDAGLEVEVTYPFMMARNNIKNQKTIDSFKNMGFKIIDKTGMDKPRSYYFMDEGFKADIISKDQFEIISASDKFLEVDGVFKSIKEKLTSIEAQEISIIADQDYEAVIKMYSEKYEIPVSSMNQLEARKLPMVKGAISFLELVLSKEKTKLISFLENKYFNTYQMDSKFLLVKELRQLNYRGVSANYENISDDLSGFLKYIGELISFIEVDPARNFLSYLVESNFRNKLVESYNNHGSLSLLKTSISSIDIIEDVAESILKLSEVLDLDKKEILEAMIENLNDYRYYSDNQVQGIRILSDINAIGDKAKIRYILGMDYTYPRRPRSEYLYSSRFQAFYKKIGFVIKDKYEEIDNEILKFASLIDGSKLVFSYAYEDLELAEKKSYFVDKLLYEEEIDANYNYRSLIDFSKQGFSRPEDRLLGDLYETKSGLVKIDYMQKEDIDKLNSKIIKYQEKLGKNQIYWGDIESDLNKERIFRSKITNSYSPSMLNSYNKCPYQFYLTYLIGLEEFLMDYDDKFYLEKGIYYHKILNRFYEENKEYKSMEEGLIRDKLTEIIEDELKGKGLENEIKKTVYLSFLNEFILADRKFYESIDGDFKPALFEEKLYRRIGDINISGRVDRVDEDSHGRRIIMDYKSSNNPSNVAVENMEELQIPIYMLLAGDKAYGGLYGVVEKASIAKPFLLNEILIKKNDKNLDKQGLNLFMSDLFEKIKSIDQGIKRGKFTLNSKDENTCNRCEYRDICMKEDWSNEI